MALPKIDLPTYKVKLPSNGETITYRPFTVKENKIILIALQSEDENEIIQATQQVVNNCVITPKNFDIDKVAFFDIEFLILKLRSKSISETIKLEFHGDSTSECPGCRKNQQVEVDLEKVDITKNKDFTNKIQFDCGIGFIMKIPTFHSIKKFYSVVSSQNVFDSTEQIIDCIESIFDADKVYDPKDHKKEELLELVETLSISDFDKINKFFESFPKLEHEITYKCSVCKTEKYYTLSGLLDFLV